MRKWTFVLAALLLAGCRAAGVPVTPEPDPEPEIVREPEPAPTPDPQQMAAQWLSDDGHHAFFVNGHIVTVERAAEPTEDCRLILTIWDRADPTVPIQTIRMAEDTRFDGDKSLDPAWNRVENFNFDGYEDFGCVYAMGNQPVFYHVWLWDPEAGQYVYEPAFDGISYPEVDWAEEKITGWARSSAATGDHSIYKWIDGVLTEVRHIKIDFEDMWDINSLYASVTDLVDGEMREVFRMKSGEEGCSDVIAPWFNLWYPEE